MSTDFVLTPSWNTAMNTAGNMPLTHDDSIGHGGFHSSEDDDDVPNPKEHSMTTRNAKKGALDHFRFNFSDSFKNALVLLGLTGYTVHPNGSFRLGWDAFGAVLIFYDLLVIPFSQAFKPAPTPASDAIDWLALIFWTCDMLQAPFLGFYSKGEYITDKRRIMVNYLRSWFLVDLVVVGPEWL